MTHDIKLPLDKEIVFPPICVVCEKPSPDSQLELSFSEARFSVMEAASTVLTRTTYHVDQPSHQYLGIPVCAAYAERLKAHHRALKVVSYGLWALGVVLAFVLPVSLGWKIAVVLVFLVLPVVISLAFPPALDVTFSKGAATFSFTSARVADEFRALNTG